MPRGEAEPITRWHVLLAGLTVCTTMLAGASLDPLYSDLGPIALTGLALHHPSVFLAGLPFSLPLLFILGVHEMGHFVTARWYGIRATWPYFLPGPPVFSLGTFGAFIRLKGAIPTRGALMDVGVGGPFWGFLASVAVAASGFIAARAGYHAPADLGMDVNLPLAYRGLQMLILGDSRGTLTFFENPVLLAAWLGLFIQGLNLLPVGQLDGGHVLYAFAKARHRWVSTAIAVALLAYALVQPQWIVWAALLFFVLGLRHPPTLYDDVPMTPRQVALGVAAAIIFVLCFLPAPFTSFS